MDAHSRRSVGLERKLCMTDSRAIAGLGGLFEPEKWKKTSLLAGMAGNTYTAAGKTASRGKAGRNGQLPVEKGLFSQWVRTAVKNFDAAAF